jgi:hypothetical protein
MKNGDWKISPRVGHWVGENIYANRASTPTDTDVCWVNGDKIIDTVAPSSGTHEWIVSTTGAPTPGAWVLSTAYVIGDTVLNDTNNIYICTVAGTSAGSGGPTGTGTGITDNTVTWDYVSELAVFTANTY